MDPPHDHGTLDQGIAIVHSAEAPSDGGEDSQKNPTIAVRLNRDRGAIQPRSWIFRHGITSTIIRQRSLVDRDHDRCPIAARSSPDRGAIAALLKQNLGSFHANPEATSPPRGVTPTTHQIRSHDRVNCPRSSG